MAAKRPLPVALLRAAGAVQQLALLTTASWHAGLALPTHSVNGGGRASAAATGTHIGPIGHGGAGLCKTRSPAAAPWPVRSVVGTSPQKVPGEVWERLHATGCGDRSSVVCQRSRQCAVCTCTAVNADRADRGDVRPNFTSVVFAKNCQKWGWPKARRGTNRRKCLQSVLCFLCCVRARDSNNEASSRGPEARVVAFPFSYANVAPSSWCNPEFVSDFA